MIISHEKNQFSQIGSLFFLCLIISLSACTTIKPKPEPLTDAQDQIFKNEPIRVEGFASVEQVEKLSESIAKDYLLGSGDVLSIKVWQRPELSEPQIVVGPDGVISVMRIGNIKVAGRTREDITLEITEKLSKLYTKPEVMVSIKEYKNNKAFVLGRVENPGVVTFPGKGTLLEALSLAGGLPIVAEQAFLTKCAIIRGKDMIIWIDLNDLLHNGNMSLNARIRNNDVIFIPESQAELVYVMGEVLSPGAIRLTGQLTMMDALMKSGGPGPDADTKQVFLIRAGYGGKGNVKEIDLMQMLATGNFDSNYLLHDNDVIFVGKHGMAKFNYFISQLLPSLRVINLGTDVMESFGVMQQLRNLMWGQEGTVGKGGN